MKPTPFDTFDLNLIPVLLMLLERRSASRAAEDLGVTQSAVSHALGRLREALDDPLFERRGGEFVPTDYAIELGRRARPAIEQLFRCTSASSRHRRRAEG